jgi:hypothetical protein
MAGVMKSVKLRSDPLFVELCAKLGMAIFVVLPVIKIVRFAIEHHSLLMIRGPMDCWGWGPFCMTFGYYLERIHIELRSLTLVLYQRLKDPDDEEAAISLATYRRLRARLGLEDPL